MFASQRVRERFYKKTNKIKMRKYVFLGWSVVVALGLKGETRRNILSAVLPSTSDRAPAIFYNTSYAS